MQEQTSRNAVVQMQEDEPNMTPEFQEEHRKSIEMPEVPVSNETNGLVRIFNFVCVVVNIGVNFRHHFLAVYSIWNIMLSVIKGTCAYPDTDLNCPLDPQYDWMIWTIFVITIGYPLIVLIFAFRSVSGSFWKIGNIRSASFHISIALNLCNKKFRYIAWVLIALSAILFGYMTFALATRYSLVYDFWLGYMFSYIVLAISMYGIATASSPFTEEDREELIALRVQIPWSLSLVFTGAFDFCYQVIQVGTTNSYSDLKTLCTNASSLNGISEREYNLLKRFVRNKFRAQE